MLLKLNLKTGNNNGQLENCPGLVSLLDKYEERLYADSSDGSHQQVESKNVTDDERPRKETNNRKWMAEISPCLSKLVSASQALVKTLRLVHGVLRLREELPRSASAHSLQHRRDVCFAQAVSD